MHLFFCFHKVPTVFLYPQSFLILFDRKLGGPNVPSGWKGIKLGDQNDVISLEVNNVLSMKNIHNLFGVIKGYIEPGRN